MYKVTAKIRSNLNTNQFPYYTPTYEVWYYDPPREGTETAHLPDIPYGYYYDIKVTRHV